MLTALNNLLIFLHLRRRDPWSPPTPLDHLLTSPLQWAVALLYTRLLLPLRGHPFHPPPHKRPIRVVCLSDTHNLTLRTEDVPGGDVLIHCGDLTQGGTVAEVQAQVDWLRRLPHRWKVVVGGNHDSCLDEGVRKGMPGRGGDGEVDWSGVEYLCGSGVEVVVEGGRRLNVWGWGALPWCGEGFA